MNYKKSPSEIILLTFFVLFIGFALWMIGYTIYLSANGYFFRDGVVLSKEYKAAHTETYYDAALETTMTKYVPDKFYFRIQKEVEGEVCTRKINVSKKAYEAFEIGQYYDWERE